MTRKSMNRSCLLKANYSGRSQKGNVWGKSRKKKFSIQDLTNILIMLVSILIAIIIGLGGIYVNDIYNRNQKASEELRECKSNQQKEQNKNQESARRMVKAIEENESSSAKISFNSDLVSVEEPRVNSVVGRKFQYKVKINMKEKGKHYYVGTKIGNEWWPKEELIESDKNGYFVNYIEEFGTVQSLGFVVAMVPENIHIGIEKWLSEGVRSSNYPGYPRNGIVELADITIIFN